MINKLIINKFKVKNNKTRKTYDLNYSTKLALVYYNK